MSEENINYKKLVSQYLLDAEKFFPPDWSYKKNSQFRSITPDFVLDCATVMQQLNFSQEQVEYFLQKVSSWCAWSYIDAEPMFLDEANTERILSSMIYHLSDSYISCVRKERTLEECDEILDEIAKDKFTQLVDAYLSKGIITKYQAIDVKMRNAKENSSANIEFNNENSQNMKLLLTGLVFLFVVIPLVIALTAKLNVFVVMATSILLAILCYWLYITILHYRLKNHNMGLMPATVAGGGASDNSNNQGGQGNVRQIAVKQEFGDDKNTQGLVRSTGIRSLILLKAGSSIMPYTQGYTEGQLPVLVAKLRNKFIAKYNFELPPVEIQEDRHLGDCEYRIIIRRKEIYDDFKGSIVFSKQKDAKPPMEELAEQIEKCVERHINKLKGWSFAKNARAEDFKNDL